MRIGIFIPAFLSGKGGAEKISSYVANIVSARGGEASIVCLPGRAPSWPLRPDVDVRVVDLADDNAILGERNRYDAILGFGMSNFFGRIPQIAKLLGVPFAIQETTSPWRMVSHLYAGQEDGCVTLDDAFWFRQAVFKEAAAIRFMVPAYAETVCPTLKPKTYAFYNAPFYDALTATLDAPVPTKRKIICVGAMKGANKNGLAAVEAIAAIAADYPGWELHLYGRNSFREQTENLQQSSPIIDHGIVEDVKAIYADASFLVIPSFEEGLPNVVTEAFSFGIPCIGFSDCPGVNYLIQDNVTGLLVDRAEPQGLQTAMSTLTSESLRNELGKHAKTYADKNFRWQDFERNWLTLLTNVVSGERPAAGDRSEARDTEKC